jgi:hypothetical protein
VAQAPASASPPIIERAAFELAVFALADDLDLPPRRVRGSLARLLRRLRTANVTLDAAERLLEEWIAAG